MKAMRLVGGLALVLLIGAAFTGTASAQYSFSGDMTFASRYIWRGTRVTDEPVLQPSMTLGIGDFSYNVWGNMDLTDISFGCCAQGYFTEVDHTFSYDYSMDDVTLSGGVIFYTFKYFNTTAEIYGGVTFDNVLLSPSATVYFDVDETSCDTADFTCTLPGGGAPGIYVLLGAGHSFDTGNDTIPSIDVSGTFAFANEGYTDFYFGSVGAGATDASVTLSVPFEINDNLSAGAFVTYSGLVRDTVRAAQYGDSEGPNDPDTVWGGASISLSF